MRSARIGSMGQSLENLMERHGRIQPTEPRMFVPIYACCSTRRSRPWHLIASVIMAHHRTTAEYRFARCAARCPPQPHRRPRAKTG
jgi:hypothetical protein